jgi:DNA-binding NarL/FixJ family response regulator
MPLPDDSPPGFHPHELTARELAVLQMLADGMATREIAEELSYSERTVKNVVHDLLEKLNCRTRAHAVALAIRHGVI